MTGPDLKPCPFCGGNNVRAFRHVPMQPDPCVMCRDCYASAVSVAAWNRRDPAVLDALPEVQAMIAAAVKDAARLCDAKHADYMISKGRDPEKYGSAYSLLARSIRAITPADATAALARIERDAEARGMVKGLRDAAEALIPTRGATLPYQQAAILARADQIEGDSK